MRHKTGGSTTRGHVDKCGSMEDETDPDRATRDKVPEEQRHAQRRKDKRGSPPVETFPDRKNPGLGPGVGRKKWLIEPVKLPDLLSGSERVLLSSEDVTPE